ncbi:hypothetical protein Chor_004574 [Crotalus horridus]
MAGQTLPPGFPAPFLFADGLSSVETLLTNIQGLLKVAVDNARVQEKQIQQEKKELKMELCRERELRENLERQLTAELQSREALEKGEESKEEIARSSGVRIKEERASGTSTEAGHDRGWAQNAER